MAHAFTFWGFTILMFTILEAYGALFDKDFFVPLIGRGRALGFIEDFFAVAVLVALCVFTGIRYVNSPKRKGRLSRFFGSHTGAAWLVLVMIASVMLTLIGYRAAQVNTGDFPYGNSWWPFASHAVSRLFSHFGAGVNSDLETVLLILNIAVIVGFAVFLSYSKHLHIALAPINVATSRRPRALGPLYNTPDMDMENVSEDTVFGAGHIEDLSWKQLLDTLTCTECGRCQSVCPAWNTDKPLSPKLLIMGLRDNLFESAPRLFGSPPPAGGRDSPVDAAACGRGPEGRGPHPRPGHHRPRRAVVVSHLRGVRGGVPGRHRARRHHRGDAPLRGAHGVALPDRGRVDAAQHREPGRPLGSRRRQADRVDRGPRLRGPRDHRHHPRRHRVPLLGGVRRGPRRAGPQGDPGHGAPAAPGRGALRHPRPPRVLHR